MESLYQNVKYQFIEEGGMQFVSAEPPGTRGRQHKRILLVSEDRHISGRVVLYADTYSGSSEDVTYLYARHNQTPGQFCGVLNRFLGRLLADFPEMRGRSFPIVANIGGKPVQFETELPISELDLFSERLRFFRVTLPLGAVAVEFGMESPGNDETLALRNNSTLPCSIESPLIGCEFSRGTELAPLLASVHWARENIPPTILEHLIEQLTYNPVAG